MSDYEHYEALVVGAGPSGAATAATFANYGIETLVLERDVETGSKNVSSGLIYAEEPAPYTIDDFFPGFREAAAERPITKHRIHNIAGDKVESFNLMDLHEHDTEWSDSVLWRKMNSWLEARAHERTRETGDGLLTGVHVNGLLREEDHIVGVTLDEFDPITADIIVAADGVNPELARDAGLMDWDKPNEWFQGVRAVVDMPEAAIADWFDVTEDEGAAHLFSGDPFEGVHGGGFLYTNRDALSLETVFHLDSLVTGRAEPYELLDGLLTHPLLAQWLGDDYTELGYSAKPVPDSKKVALCEPHFGRLLLVGDAAGQMQVQGPITKGMNHAATVGVLAAKSYAQAESRDEPEKAGIRYTRKLRSEGVMKKLQPRSYELLRDAAEDDGVTDVVDTVLTSAVGRAGIRALSGRLEHLYNVPTLSALMPDTQTPYVTLPAVIAEELGTRVHEASSMTPPDLRARIGELTYDTNIGNPHITFCDGSYEVSEAAVAACLVSAVDFNGGCYREEVVRTNDSEERVVSLDTQPYVKCGTCAVVADTDWSHPCGDKGVESKWG